MLELYDALHRNRRTVDDFERLVGTALESGASFDRGAARLLEETRFLAAAFRAYDVALAAAGLVDEHGLRARLLTLEAGATPLTSVVVAVPDLAAAGDGLWPADYDLLTRVAGLESLTVVATEALLGTGYLTRLLDTLPDVEVVAFAGDQPPAPVLATAAADQRRARQPRPRRRSRGLRAAGPRGGAAGAGRRRDRARPPAAAAVSLPGAPGPRRLRRVVAGGRCAAPRRRTVGGGGRRRADLRRLGRVARGRRRAALDAAAAVRRFERGRRRRRRRRCQRRWHGRVERR